MHGLFTSAVAKTRMPICLKYTENDYRDGKINIYHWQVELPWQNQCPKCLPNVNYETPYFDLQLDGQDHKAMDLGRNEHARMIRFLNQVTLCKTTKLGGAGLRSTEAMNKAMLAKLAWRVTQQPKASWCNLIRAK